MTKQNKQTSNTPPLSPKSGTDSVRCQLFLEGTVFLRFLLLSADAEAKAAPCVPGLGVQGLLTQEFPFPSTVHSAHRRLPSLPTECEVILVLRLCCKGTPSRACQSHHPLLSYAWGRRAGGAVLWQLLCTRDLNWQSYSFPWVFIYIFLSSNGTSMFRKMYLWKKPTNLLPRFHVQAKNLFISYLHSQNFFGSAHFTARYGNFSSSLRREEHGGTVLLPCI